MGVRVVLRMGSHAEKEYLEKLGDKFDGLVLGANLVEATPGASASLVVKLCGKKKQLAFILDPMTYAYGSYVDPEMDSDRTDLDWIKSEQKTKGKVVRRVKSSYRKLAKRLGAPFHHAIEQDAAVSPADLSTRGAARTASQATLEYQLTRMQEEIGRAHV